MFTETNFLIGFRLNSLVIFSLRCSADKADGKTRVWILKHALTTSHAALKSLCSQKIHLKES